MTMLFRTFDGYVKNYAKRKRRDSADDMCTFDDLGKEVVYSDETRYNIWCKTGAEHFLEASLKNDKSFQRSFRKYLNFAETYYQIGCITVMDDITHNMHIVTDSVYTNAYVIMEDRTSFFVLFNARPVCASPGSNNIVRIGYDDYGLVVDNKSAIVWDIDRYIDCMPANYTLWGIRQGTGRGDSITDDELIGVKDGKEIHIR